MPIVESYEMDTYGSDVMWQNRCELHGDCLTSEHQGPRCNECNSLDLSQMIKRIERPEVEPFDNFPQRRITGLSDWDERPQVTPQQVQNAIRYVLARKHAALYGRAYDIVSEYGMEKAVNELFNNLLSPVLKRLDVLPPQSDNVDQGTLPFTE